MKKKIFETILCFFRRLIIMVTAKTIVRKAYMNIVNTSIWILLAFARRRKTVRWLSFFVWNQLAVVRYRRRRPARRSDFYQQPSGKCPPRWTKFCQKTTGDCTAPCPDKYQLCSHSHWDGIIKFYADSIQTFLKKLSTNCTFIPRIKIEMFLPWKNIFC